MVQQDVLEDFLGWLAAVLRNLLERFVCWCENGVIGLSAVERLDKIIVLIDQLCKLSCVLALANELIDSPIWLVVVWVMRVMRLAVVWRSLMRRVVWRSIMRRVVWMITMVIEVDDAVVELCALKP